MPGSAWRGGALRTSPPDSPFVLEVSLGIRSRAGGQAEAPDDREGVGDVADRRDDRDGRGGPARAGGAAADAPLDVLLRRGRVAPVRGHLRAARVLPDPDRGR